MQPPARVALNFIMVLALLLNPGGVVAQEGDGGTADGPPAPEFPAEAWPAPAVTPTDVNVQSVDTGYLYALRDVNGGANQIYGFQVNELTGALTPLGGFPIATGGNGVGNTLSERMVYDAANSRLYVVNDGSNTLSAFTVNLTTGTLSAMPFSPVNLGSSSLWSCVEVHPSGSPVMVSNDSGFASLNITNSSATPASGSPFNAGTDPRSCALSQDGAYLFGGEAGATGTAVFSINPGTGVLTAIPGSPFATGNFVKAAYATDGFGRLLLADFFGGTLSLFTTSSGAPTAVSGNPFTSVLTNAIHGVVHPSGYYMVADRIGNRVGVYRISGSGSATSLAAVSGSPFAAGGSFTDILALNYDGAYLFAANGDTRNLTTFSVNAGTGALLSLGTQITDTLGATGRITGLSYAKPLQPPVRNGSGFVYTLKDVGTGNEIFGYSVNETTGALTALPGFPLGTGGNGTGSDAFQRIAYDPANARLYALNDGSNTISAYSVNRTMGAIAPLPFSPMSLGDRLWYCVSVAPNGSTLLAGELLSGTIASFSITSSSATQAAGSPYNSNSQAASCAFSQDGAYFYAGGNPANFAGFSVNGTTSVLTALSGSPFNSGGTVPIGFASDNAGRLFMTNAVSNTVRVFTTLGGVPSPVLGNPFTSGLTFGIYGILHPGGYYMVSDRGGNRVGVYRIQGSGPSTTLTAVSGSPFGSGGTFTQGLALNRAGTFLLAANGNSRNVTTYAVDAATGALNAANVQPPNTSGSTGTLTGMAYVPGLFGVYVPLILK